MTNATPTGSVCPLRRPPKGKDHPSASRTAFFGLPPDSRNPSSPQPSRLLDSPHHHADVGLADEKSGLTLNLGVLGGFARNHPLSVQPEVKAGCRRPGKPAPRGYYPRRNRRANCCDARRSARTAVLPHPLLYVRRPPEPRHSPDSRPAAPKYPRSTASCSRPPRSA